MSGTDVQCENTQLHVILTSQISLCTRRLYVLRNSIGYLLVSIYGTLDLIPICANYLLLDLVTPMCGSGVISVETKLI